MFEYLTSHWQQIPAEFWNAVGEMSPYLLFGFLMAGVLSALVSAETVERHLGGKGLMPVIKAAAFGVPLPLCSCSVIPVSASLSRHGASRGAVVGFLISTPQTGVDSIMVTLSMLGPVVAIYRPIAALLSGILGGWAVELFHGGQGNSGKHDESTCETCQAVKGVNRILRIFKYGFVNLPEDIGKALLLGLVVSALISALMPKDYFSTVLPSGPLQMLVMMAAGIPLYVCATASVPIAAALITAGVSPGAAFAFLVTGPATNAATIATIWKLMGRRTCLIYLLVIAASAVGGGVILDMLVTPSDVHRHVHEMSEMLPPWVGTASAIVLLGLLSIGIVRPIWGRITGKPVGHDHAGHDHDGHSHGEHSKCCESHSDSNDQEVMLKIKGMSCEHCVSAVEKALRECHGVSSACVNLAAGTARVKGEKLEPEKLIAAVQSCGFETFIHSSACSCQS